MADKKDVIQASITLNDMLRECIDSGPIDQDERDSAYVLMMRNLRARRAFDYQGPNPNTDLDSVVSAFKIASDSVQSVINNTIIWPAARLDGQLACRLLENATT
jgi:hypothetical protein